MFVLVRNRPIAGHAETNMMRPILLALAAVLLAFPMVGGSADTAQARQCNGWKGNFTGTRPDKFDPGVYRPFGNQKCFNSEAECKKWLGQQSGTVGGGQIRAADCSKSG